MVKGLDIFREYFAGFEDQYVLIGGTACDILFAENAGQFRATRDIDIVLIVEALTAEFGIKFWEFIEAGQYRNKTMSTGRPQLYRFDKPENKGYPKMIELFARTDFASGKMNGLVPIHIDDEVSSLSAILLNDDYYKILLAGRVIVQELCVLRPEYLILFKMKAYLDLKARKENGEEVDSRNIKKHKNDVLRITAEFLLKHISVLPESVYMDVRKFFEKLAEEPFDASLLQNYGLSNMELVERLQEIYLF